MIFDVMLPFYGDVALMQAAVRSVLAQTHQDWRLTVVDDGQEPGVPEWFASISDPRVRYQRNPHNLGISRNYQQCVRLAEHPYMIMMGSDDIMLPNYLACLDDILTEYPGVAMVQPGVEVIDSTGRVVWTLADAVKKRLYHPRIRSRRVMGGEELATSLLRGCWFYFPSICWRTDAIQKVNFRDDLHVIQDLALVIDLLRLGEQMVVDPVVCFQYRRHAVSASSAGALSGSRFDEARRFFVETADELKAFGWPRAARAARHYLSSRLHAGTLLPAAIRAGNRSAIAGLIRHAFGPARP
ncbi:MAG: glycosyltransferase [Micromonosporaceae bacterium]|nr:glycosyltransferase [Micromonosporaceae bacterium]